MGRKLPVWLTQVEREKVLELDLSIRDRAIIMTFLYTGLRANELRFLDVQDVDFESLTLFVRRGKGNKQRIIPLHAEAATILTEHLQGRTAGPIFKSNRRQRISYDRLHSLVQEIGSQANLKKQIHPHVFRHTFAVSLREAGEELDVLAALLGHENIGTTAIYTHCSVSQLRSAVNRI